MTCSLSNLNWYALAVVLLAHVLVLAGIPALQHSVKPKPPDTVLLASLLTLQSEPPAPEIPPPPRLEPPKPEPAKPAQPQPSAVVQPQPEPPPVVQIAVDRPAAVVVQAPPMPPAPPAPVALPEQPRPLVPEVEAVPAASKPSPSAASQARERDEFNAYLLDLIRHLKRHKKYPASLKKAKVEGKVTLRFTLDAFGRVIASGVSVGSGSAELDQAAMSMLVRANPLPAMPKSLQKDQQTLVIPIEYSLITDR